ncbi:RICIN domain-containing protein [Vallitalea guaymasensis]|uniref:RICIN domain-containing protein n=1 Tax=Vallitalea guaymasensis TaxID=1185412 RepID=UPI002356A22E|nr:RICIN domain-containing protein [Vallitalea guaymasensis]
MKRLLSILVICSLMTVTLGIGATTASAATPRNILVNYYSGKALTTSCDNIQQNNIILNDSQIWHIIKKGSTCGQEYFAIENHGSGKVMEVENSSTKRYANIQQANYTGADNQLWFIEYCETHDYTAYYHIKNKNSGQLLSILSPYGGEGSNAEQYDADRNSDWQLWSIVSIEDR